MTLYYQDDAVTLHHGDCRSALGGVVADVLITDPPYGFGHYETDVDGYPILASLVGRFRTVAVMGYPERLAVWAGTVSVRSGHPISEWVTWWAPNARHGRHKGLVAETEAVAIFGELPGVGELKVPRSEDSKRLSANGKSRGGGATYDPDFGRMGDVWRDVKPAVMMRAGQRFHPNEKPLSLMRRLVTLCSRPGDVILDPFAGSGTTLRAAKDLGRRAIGFEIDEGYCATATARLAQGVLGYDCTCGPVASAGPDNSWPDGPPTPDEDCPLHGDPNVIGEAS